MPADRAGCPARSRGAGRSRAPSGFPRRVGRISSRARLVAAVSIVARRRSWRMSRLPSYRHRPSRGFCVPSEPDCRRSVADVARDRSLIEYDLGDATGPIG